MRLPRKLWSLAELLLAIVAAALLYPILSRFVVTFSEALGARRP